MKLLVAPRAGEVVQTMGESGFLEPILGGVGYTKRLSRLIAIEAERGVGGDAVLRLAALGVAIPEDADRLRDRLRLANAEADRLRAAAAALIGLHGTRAPPSFHGLRDTPVQRRSRSRARRAGARSRRVRSAPVGRGLRRGRPISRRRARTQAADQRCGPDRAGRRGGAAGRSGATRLPGAVDPAGFPKEPETLARLLEEAVAESVGGDRRRRSLEPR